MDEESTHDDEGNHQGRNRKARPPRHAAPRPKGAGPSPRASRRGAPAEGGDRQDKPDTSGGVKIKLRGASEDGGLISVEDLKQELQQLARNLDQYPAETRFKWATFYMTPVDQEGNKIASNGPKHQLMTPYKSAASEHKL